MLRAYDRMMQGQKHGSVYGDGYKGRSRARRDIDPKDRAALRFRKNRKAGKGCPKALTYGRER